MKLTISHVKFVLLILLFISGFFMLLNNDINIYVDENFDGGGAAAAPPSPSAPSADPNCPYLLIKRDGKYHLFFQNNHIQPLVFSELQDYAEYVKENQNHCPVLFLQQENDAQGNDVYRIRQNPFYIEGGLPPLPMEIHDNTIPIQEKDASRENGFNQNMYPGFDPYGLYVGRFTEKDVVHESTAKDPAGSLNPADPNWRGVLETQRAVDAGVFKENEVNKIILPNMAK